MYHTFLKSAHQDGSNDTHIAKKKNSNKIIKQEGPCGLAGVHFDLFGPAGRVKSHFQAKKSYGHCSLHSSNELRLCSALNFKLCQKTGRPTLSL